MKEEKKLFVQRTTNIGQVSSRNKRLITEGVWRKALERYKEEHGNLQIPVTFGSDVYMNPVSMTKVLSVDMSTVVGYTTDYIFDDRIEVRFADEEKYKMVINLINDGFTAGLRCTAGLHHFIHMEEDDGVTVCGKIKIISFDLLSPHQSGICAASFPKEVE